MPMNIIDIYNVPTLNEPAKETDVEIVDVRSSSPLSDSFADSDTASTFSTSSTSQPSMAVQILQSLNKPTNKKSLTTMLLYDERGLRLYDDITTKAPEYYLFGAEENILKKNSDQIVSSMFGPNDKQTEQDAVVLELGAGSLRKTSHVLLSLSKQADKSSDKQNITYYALDLEANELNRTLSAIHSSALGKELEGKVDTKGILGTYDEGLKWVECGGLSSSVSSLDKQSHDVRRVFPATTAGSLPSENSQSHGPLHIMFLGSSLGNFSRPDSSSFLRSLPLRSASSSRPADTLLIGLDHANEKSVIESAYNDGQGYTRRFIMNGLKGAGRALGNEQLFGVDAEGGELDSKFEYVNLYDENKRRHEAYFKVTEDHTVKVNVDDLHLDNAESEQVGATNGFVEINFRAGERIKIEESNKYSDEDAHNLFTASNLRPMQRWTDPTNRYSLWLLERPPFVFPPVKGSEYDAVSSPLDTESTNSSSVNPSGNASNAPSTNADDSSATTHSGPHSSTNLAPFAAPSIDDWRRIWAAWDNVTLGMIPKGMLHQKPIDLRHICLFYLGHVPAFLDIFLDRHLKGIPHPEMDLNEEEQKEKAWFHLIFERGIDPNVDDPSMCHAHSEVPVNEEDWPSLDRILNYRDMVRERVLKLYEQVSENDAGMGRRLARVLVMTYEHEGMHLETLLYMLLQRAGSSSDQISTLPPPGFNPPSWDSLSSSWDEAAARYDALPEERKSIKLGGEGVFVTLGHNDLEDEDFTKDGKEAKMGTHEFGWDNEHPERQVAVGEFRIEWRPVTNGEFFEFYHAQKRAGKHTKLVLPASWIEKEDGETHVRTFYGPVPLKIARDWPVITSYDNLSTYAIVKGGRLPTEPELRLFHEKFECGYEGGANLAFRNWHPVPATVAGTAGGKGTNGGVWEWTSTKFDKYDGFVPSELYPGYSLDFFDGVHQVVLGGSYSTIPRIASRTTFRNWYQRNYPYAWVGGRVCYDV